MKIFRANAAMTEMTAFTRSELTNQDLKNILPELANLDSNSVTSPGEVMFNDRLITRQGNQINVRIGLHFLNRPGTWGIAIIETIANYENSVASNQRLSERLSDIHSLIENYFENDENLAILRSLEIGQKITGATHLAIYLVQANEPKLRFFISNGSLNQFPDVINPDTSWQISESQLWKPGIRATNDLHRVARQEKYSYLAIKPLGEESRIIGILVFVGRDVEPPDDYEILLGILSLTITGIIQHKVFKENLISDELSTKRKLIISNNFIEATLEGFIVLSPELTIQEMNPAAESMLGYATREVFGQPVGNVMIGSSNLIPVLQSAQAGIPTSNLGEVHLVRRDGNTFLAHISTLPLKLEETVIGIAIILRDLSEHEQYEIQNQQLEQRALLGEVTAIFAHEVRNPINNISTGLQILSMEVAPEHPHQELIARLSQDCNRLTHLMQAVLTFSRPAENALEIIDLAELIPTIVERWRPRLARFNISHDVNVITNKARIEGDPRALEQVFNNLISNAIEAMKDTGGKLSVIIRPARTISGKEYVEVNVIDNGPGIPENLLNRIFDPFVTSNRNGTGLGLSIAKRIVNKHKGTINVTSVPGGTVFQSVFPILDVEKVE
jgi:PAS domain S-box-containing protein